MEPILSVEDLSVSFARYDRGLSRRSLSALRGLSLAVEPGQVLAVVGESGAGKSLLAHTILHILPRNAQAAGTIRYGGASLTRERAEVLRGREVALIPQGVTFLDPMMKVGSQIRRGENSPDARARCRQVLERYGLGPETEELYPFQLSGGMARRVLIACAVMERPRLIIADEPTPGLDAKAAGRVLGHFRELAEQGAGVLFITHDLTLALSVADRITVLYDGQTADTVSPSQFRAGTGLTHPYTRALRQAMPENDFL